MLYVKVKEVREQEFGVETNDTKYALDQVERWYRNGIELDLVDYTFEVYDEDGNKLEVRP